MPLLTICQQISNLVKLKHLKQFNQVHLFGSWFGNLGKKALTNIAIPLARDNLSGLVRI